MFVCKAWWERMFFLMCRISVSFTKWCFWINMHVFWGFFVRKHVTAATEAWLCLLSSEKPSFRCNNTNVKFIKNHHDRRVAQVVTRGDGAAQSGRLLDIPLLSGMSVPSVSFPIYLKKKLKWLSQWSIYWAILNFKKLFFCVILECSQILKSKTLVPWLFYCDYIIRSVNR